MSFGARHNSHRPHRRIEKDDNDNIGRVKRTYSSPLRIYFVHHLWVALSTLGQLCRTPFSTFLTSSVIAIALSLPMGLLVLLDSVQQLTQHWKSSTQISVFLKHDVPETNALQLKALINDWPEVQSVTYISPAEALQEFKQASGFGEVLDKLVENPLPPVLAVIPAAGINTQSALGGLLKKINAQSHVELVQIDLAWLQRLDALVEIGHRTIMLLASLFAIAILLIVGNTLRLTIFNRRKEILVTKLIGGTGAFIRRPFLYIGFWYGLFGAILAWIVVESLLFLLHGPIEQLTNLYHSQFDFETLTLSNSLLLFAGSVTLGITGSWLAVMRHLKTIEPS